MEKRIPFVQFQSIKSVAKAIDPYLRQKARLEAMVESLDAEFMAKAEEELKKLKERLKANRVTKQQKLEADIQEVDNQISAIEAGIVSIIGFHVTDLVKKVIEPNDKGIKETRYLPTDIVSYDTATKEFVVTVPDEEPVEETTVPPTTEDGPGSDYDADKASFQSDGGDSTEESEGDVTEIPTEVPTPQEEVANQMPWEN